MKKPAFTRIDQLLVERGLVADLATARSLLMAGKVLVDDRLVDKPGAKVAGTAVVRVNQKPFVSRGGLKLAGFLEETGLAAEVNNALVLDIGSSTGGFTDCCLRLGARGVHCVDVGSNLLAWELRHNPRVILHESTHIKDFESDAGFDIMLADVSFNSIQRLFEHVHRLNRGGRALIILLVKPQFELDRRKVPAGGVIADEADRLGAVAGVIQALGAAGYEVSASRPSRLKGAKGNQEYFLAARFVGGGGSLPQQP